MGVDEDIMHAIAQAESGYQNVPNYMYDGEGGYYTAFGAFQITRSTYREYCGNPDERLEVFYNVRCAVIIAKESGIHHWNQSKYISGGWGWVTRNL